MLVHWVLGNLLSLVMMVINMLIVMVTVEIIVSVLVHVVMSMIVHVVMSMVMGMLIDMLMEVMVVLIFMCFYFASLLLKLALMLGFLKDTLCLSFSSHSQSLLLLLSS